MPTIETASNIDETVIVNGELLKSWTCPHCGRVNYLTRADNEVFMRFMKFIRHCEHCSYLHYWELRLTDNFMEAVIQMIMDDIRKEEEEVLRE